MAHFLCNIGKHIEDVWEKRRTILTFDVLQIAILIEPEVVNRKCPQMYYTSLAFLFTAWSLFTAGKVHLFDRGVVIRRHAAAPMMKLWTRPK